MDNTKGPNKPKEPLTPKTSLRSVLAPEYFIPEINYLGAAHPHRLTEDGVIALIVNSKDPKDVDAWAEAIGNELLARGQVTADVAEDVGLRILSHFAERSEKFLWFIHNISKAKEEADARLKAWKLMKAEEERERGREELAEALFDKEFEVRYAREQAAPPKLKFGAPSMPPRTTLFEVAPAFQSRPQYASTGSASQSRTQSAPRITEYEQPSAWLPSGLPLVPSKPAPTAQGSREKSIVPVSHTFGEKSTQTDIDSDTDNTLGDNNEVVPVYPLMRFDFPAPGPSFAAGASKEVLEALKLYGPMPNNPGMNKFASQSVNHTTTQGFGTPTPPFQITTSLAPNPTLAAPRPPLAILPSAPVGPSAFGGPVYRPGAFGPILVHPGESGPPVQKYNGFGSNTNINTTQGSKTPFLDLSQRNNRVSAEPLAKDDPLFIFGQQIAQAAARIKLAEAKKTAQTGYGLAPPAASTGAFQPIGNDTFGHKPAPGSSIMACFSSTDSSNLSEASTVLVMSSETDANTGEEPQPKNDAINKPHWNYDHEKIDES
ncbi:hypothetical protein TWF718_005692 [Orbilia javanica]|uniref:Uncharacterized protein n=1 Tax=Orbilia javanica TaxID=47235 RepID=A0AAN8MZC7_9PEZI